MRIQLSNRALILVVGITVLAETVSGWLTNDDELRTDKIVGGRQPKKSKHPYLVFIQRPDYSVPDNELICGGTLIDKKWVLTAGHCVGGRTVEEPSRITLTVGVFRLDQTDRYEKEIPVDNIIRHRQYNDDTLQHDIALLKLKEEAPIDGFRVKTTPLPNDRTQFQWAARCVTAGWGDTNGRTETPSNVLLEAYMAQTTIKECRLRWAKKYINFEYNLCAIDQQARSTPCDGDSGGPLMCQDRTGAYVLAGVASSGDEFCNPKSPFVFMKVSAYTDWILTNMRFHG